MQILRRIKAYYGRGFSAWDGDNGLDKDLVHIDNHLPNITYTGAVTAGTAASATPATVPGRAQLFVDGTYAVTNRDISGTLAVTAYTPIAGALACNGTSVLVNTGTSWVNIFASIATGSIPLGALQLGFLPVGITITGAQVMGAVDEALHTLSADYATNAGHATTADSLTGGGGGGSTVANGLATLTTVPATNVGGAIIVSAPHLRYMTWNGTAYVRAPWHQPGMVQYSIDNPASIPGYLPVRGDVVYAQSNYPDLIARLGLSGAGNFSLVELRGEFIRCLDNGRAVDSSRVHGSAQADDFKSHTHNWNVSIATNAGNGASWNSIVPGTMAGNTATGGAETRPRNVALPAWVSY
jgi:hypothetical protein